MSANDDVVIVPEKRARRVPKADTLDCINCPVCHGYLRGHIYQCPRGHHVCTACRPRLATCHTCRAPCGWSRVLSMEEARNRVMVQCSGASCEEECYGLDELLAHERDCPKVARCDECKVAHEEHAEQCGHKLFKCPFIALDRGEEAKDSCDAQITMHTARHHFASAHGAVFIESAEDTESSFVIHDFDVAERHGSHRRWYVAVGDTLAMVQFENDIGPLTFLSAYLLRGRPRAYHLSVAFEKFAGAVLEHRLNGVLQAVDIEPYSITIGGGDWMDTEREEGHADSATVLIRIGEPRPRALH